MNTPNFNARLAGFLYLTLVIFGILNLAYIPSQLIVWDNPAETLSNIQQSEGLFRLGIVSGILSFLVFLFLPLALYKLLAHLNQPMALVMVILVLVSIPISFANMVPKFQILDLINKPEYANSPDLADQVMFHLEAYNHGIVLSQIFWGLWLFPFGYLVYYSGFLPRFLGIMLMLGCFGYLITFFGGFLFSGYGDTLVASLVGIPSTIGEIGICLWLVIFGANMPKWLPRLPIKAAPQAGG